MSEKSEFIDYYKCTAAELRTFLGAKTGKEIPDKLKSKSKNVLVDMLEYIDSKATFRFMDLPPEMPNIIYEYLLTTGKSWSIKQSAHPAILRTCRQVYKEAHGVLLAEGTLCLKGDFGHSDGPFTSVCGSIGIIAHPKHPRSGKRIQDWSQMEQWISPLRYAHNISLEVDLRADSIAFREPEVERHSRRKLHDFLTALTAACSNAKHVTLRINSWPIVTRCKIAKILQPLVLLSEDCTLRFEELTEEEEASFWKYDVEG